MPIYSGVVTAPENDYYWRGGTQFTGATIIRAEDNNIISVTAYAVAELDVSTMPTHLPEFGISAATLHWYDSAYVKSPKAATYDGYIQIYSGAVSEIGSVYTFSTAPTTPAWNSHALTETEWTAGVNPNRPGFTGYAGSDVTSLRFNVSDPLASQSRIWDVGAYEDSKGVYLEIEYSSSTIYPASSGTPSFVQSKSATNSPAAGALSVTLDAAPTEGNTVIVAMCERSLPPSGASMTTTGYTFAGYDRVTDDTTYRRGMAIYYKVAGPSESATITGTYDNALAGATIHAVEFSGLTSFNEISFTDNGNTSNGTTLATSEIETTGSTALIMITSFKASTTYPSGGGGCSYASGFTSVSEEAVPYTWTFYNACGWVNAETSGTSGTTITLNESTVTNVGIQSAFLSFETELPEEAPAAVARRGRAIVIG